MFLVNSFYLYNQGNLQKDQLRIMAFREKVSNMLIGELLPSPQMLPTVNFHYLAAHPPSERKNKPTKPCRVYTTQNIRRES